MPLPTLFQEGTSPDYPGIPMKTLMHIFKYKKTKSKFSLNDRLFFLKSETGSAKSTGFPVALYDMFHGSSQYSDAEPELINYIENTYNFDKKSDTIANYHTTDRKILCTQPKVITAKGKAVELGLDEEHYSQMQLGSNLGYSTGPYKRYPSNKDALVYATIGTLTSQLLNWSAEKFIETYEFILVDETHEQSIELVLALYLLKTFMKENKDNPDIPIVVFMSATFSVEQFAKYFNSSVKNSIYVKGSESTKEIIFAKDDVENINDFVYKTILSLPEPTSINEDVMIFLPGAKEISDMERTLKSMSDVIVLKITSQTVNKGGNYMELITEKTITETNKHFKTKAKRRVFVSTNVAETGITIKTLKYVIDSGFERSTYYDPNHGVDLLVKQPITKNSAEQRFGRVGRVFPGIVYTAYTEKTYNMFEEYKPSDVMLKNCDRIVMRFGDHPENLLDDLPEQMFTNSKSKLYALGITGEMAELVSKMSKLTVEACRMVLASRVYQISFDDIVTIAVLNDSRCLLPYSKYRLKNNMPFFSLRQIIGELNVKSSYSHRDLDTYICDDFIENLFAYRLYQKFLKANPLTCVEKLEKFGIDHVSFMSALDIKEEIIKNLENLGFYKTFDNFDLEKLKDENYLESYIRRFKRCIYSGYNLNRIRLDDEYKTESGLVVSIPWKYIQKKAQHVLYNSIRGIENNANGTIDYVASKVSVMDGFI